MKYGCVDIHYIPTGEQSADLLTNILSNKTIHPSFLLYRSPFPHRVLIVGCWSSNPRTEAIERLEYIPLIYLMGYFISHVFDS